MVLDNPYPSPSPEVRNLLVALLFGVFISFFLIFFEPFGIDLASGKTKLYPLFFFGLITTIVLSVFLYLLPLTFPALFKEGYWKVKHQIVYCSIILLVIATLNGLYTNHINTLSFSWQNYWWIINRTFILGCIPFSILILVDSMRKERSNHKAAKVILDIKRDKRIAQEGIQWSINTQLKNESFTFNDSSFAFAEAHGNYIDFYFENSDGIKFKTYRINLTAFEKQVSAPYLCRCHRSYLVNLNRVTDITGNAQGLKLILNDKKSVVPVSRKYIPEIKRYFARSTEIDS